MALRVDVAGTGDATPARQGGHLKPTASERFASRIAQAEITSRDDIDTGRIRSRQALAIVATRSYYVNTIRPERLPDRHY